MNCNRLYMNVFELDIFHPWNGQGAAYWDYYMNESENDSYDNAKVGETELFISWRFV